MASISLSILKKDAYAMDVIPGSLTVGTSSPGANSIEIRVDVATEKVSRNDVVHALDVFKRYLLNGMTDPNFPAIPQVAE